MYDIEIQFRQTGLLSFTLIYSIYMFLQASSEILKNNSNVIPYQTYCAKVLPLQSQCHCRSRQCTSTFASSTSSPEAKAGICCNTNPWLSFKDEIIRRWFEYDWIAIKGGDCVLMNFNSAKKCLTLIKHLEDTFRTSIYNCVSAVFSTNCCIQYMIDNP